MFSSILHNALILPAAGFVLAAGTGILIRLRSARADQHLRDQHFVEE